MVTLNENLFCDNLNYKKYKCKALWVVLPDLAISCQNSLTVGFGNLPGLVKVLNVYGFQQQEGRYQ